MGSAACILYNIFGLQRGRGILGRVEANGKRVWRTQGRPRLDDFLAHLSGQEAVGGIPGTAGGTPGWCGWVAVDLDEATGEAVEAFVAAAWDKEIPVYPSRGLRRGWRLWLFLDRPVLQRRAWAIARRLGEMAEQAGLGRAEIFPSSPDAGQGKGVFLPYHHEYRGNPLLWPNLSGPIPIDRLGQLKRVNVQRVALARKQLENLCERVRQAAPGSRHDTLVRAARAAFGLPLPADQVENALRAAAHECGLPEADDPEEVERVLAWAREHGKKQPLRERVNRPRLDPPDPRHPLFAGRKGRSIYLVLRGWWEAYQQYGYSEGGSPTLQLSFRQLALASCVSLPTLSEVVKNLGKAGLLSGVWSGNPDQGTVWQIRPEVWPGGQNGGPEARPLWSRLGLGLGAGLVYWAMDQGASTLREIAERVQMHRESVRRLVRKLERSLGEREKWGENLQGAEERARHGWYQRKIAYALDRTLYREALSRPQRNSEETPAPDSGVELPQAALRAPPAMA